MTRKEATALISTYGTAWETQDADLIVTVFTEDAIYHDPKEGIVAGHDGIRQYWIRKVQNEQKDIRFTLLHVWADEDTIIAEWNAQFIDILRNFRIDMNEVAIFTVDGKKFSSLREYYSTRKTPL